MQGQSKKRGAGLDVDESGPLAEWASWRGRWNDRPVAALVDGSGTPVPFIANEVMADPDDRDLIAELTRLGATLIEPPPLLPAPTEILRSRELNRAPFPQSARLRFDRPVPGEMRDGLLREALAWTTDLDGDVRVSASGAEVAALVARFTGEGRRIGLNFLAETHALPFQTAAEFFDPTGPGDAVTNSPFTWSAFNGLSRIVHAWQTVESVRAVRSIEPVVWVAILDDGFWVDNAGAPIAGMGQAGSDFGAGVLQINLFNEGAPVGGISGIPCNGGFNCPWHGNRMASVATAGLGNGIGAAGSGATVARPVFFKCDLSDDQIYRCLAYCTAWGLDVLNMSWGRTITPGLFGIWSMPGDWERRFQFASDNGVVLVASAGNSAAELPDRIVIPATRTPGVITVGALDGNDAGPAENAGPNPVSNFGSSVDIWAPGTNIPVAPDGGSDAAGGATSSATSPAAALVSGVAAMMRAVQPTLRSEDVRRILQDTAWPGTGRVTRILNAEAAVLAALGGSLPADLGEPNNRPDRATALQPVGPGGSFRPFADRATRSRGDSDFWSFTLTRVSNVTIRLEWYRLLGHLAMVVEARDPANESADDLVEGGVPGNRTLTGMLAAGTYIVRVQGGAQTAYELDVAHRAATFSADQFEPNETFEQAKLIVFERPRLPLFLASRSWGPGDFAATLHRRLVFGPTRARISPDYYELSVPAGKGLAVPTLSISGAYHPVDVTLYDAARTVLQTWTQVRSMTVRPPQSSTCYLLVNGTEPTAYTISARLLVDPSKLPREIEEAEVIPEWWTDPDFKVNDGIAYFGLDLTGGVRPDENLTFVPTHGAVALSLLDEQGRTVAEGRETEDGIRLDTGALDRGLYFVRADARAAGPAALRLAAPKRV